MTTIVTVAYTAAFFLVCALVIRLVRKRGAFWSAVSVFALGWVFFYVVFPGLRIGTGDGAITITGIAMLVTDAKNPLVVPGFAFWAYMFLMAVGIMIVVSSSEATYAEFKRPIIGFLRGAQPVGKGGGKGAKAKPKLAASGIVRLAVLYLAVPALIGKLGFDAYKPNTAAPAEGRQAHPSISYDEKLTNPLREPSADKLAEFAKAAELGDVAEDELRQRFRAAMVHEGRHLYAKNCSPCHGGKADGTGLMARALRLAPANFTDPGTIATLVEAYAFKRIQAGGAALPAAGSPWDSAMPRWKGELTDEEIFKIMLAEYDLGGVEPRVPEKLE